MFEWVNPANLRRGLFYAAVIIMALAVQNEFFGRFSILGVRVFYMPVLVSAIGVFEGGFWGGIMGMITGVICDMTYHDTTVTYTIVLTLLGFASGLVFRFFVNRKLFSFTVVSAAALILTGFCQMLRPLVLQRCDVMSGIRVVLLQSLWSLPFVFPIYSGMKKLAEPEDK